MDVFASKKFPVQFIIGSSLTQTVSDTVVMWLTIGNKTYIFVEYIVKPCNIQCRLDVCFCV